MTRYLQITFVPHVENGWNFFMWLTNKVGEPQFFPDFDDPLADFPDWMTDESYKLLRTSAAFVSDDRTETVFGALVTMESLYRMIERRVFDDAYTDILPGETLQWFMQIAEAVQILLENGHFYPTVFHLDRGDRERCYYGQWMPDVRFFEKSGLFSDWLGRLPQLAFSIADLQSVKVRQWLYLIIIYWTDALIRFNIDPSAGDMPETQNDGPAEQRLFFDSWLSHLADDPSEPFAAANNPQVMATFARFEAEISHWVHPIAEAQPKAWMDALITYRRDQQQAYFSPETIIVYLDPLNEDEPFAPGAEWEREIFIRGWQNNEEINVPLEQLLLTREFADDSWFKKQLDKTRPAIPDRVIDLIWHHRAYTFLAAGDVFDLYQYRDTFAAGGILLEFPDHLAIRDASQKVDVDLNISTEHSGESLFGLSSLINYNWRIAIGDIELTAAEFKKLVKEEQAFIKRGNEWIHLPLERMMKAYEEMDDALELMDAAPGVAGALQLKAARQRKRNANVDIRLDSELDHYLDNLLKKPKKNIPVPEGFQGRLRPYQKKGYAWLANLREKHVGGCLADDMGLGKTIQAIAYLGHCKTHLSKADNKNPDTTGAALVICPTSLLANWKREFAVFAPELNIYVHHGPERVKNITAEQLKDVDVMITSYAIFTKEAAALNKLIWSSVILDEAQAIKNPQAKKTRALRHVNAGHRLVLTGTPIENRLEELWSIMDFLNPGYLGTLKRFKERFIQPIEKKNNFKKAKQLTKIIQPFLLRREKTDKKIIQDLPDKIEIKEQCHLSRDQASLYQSFVNHLAASVSRTEGIQRKGLILSTLTKLKQVCDHPSLVLDDSAKMKDSGKLERFFELIEPLFENNEKVLVFTQYVKMGHLLAGQVHDRYPDAGVMFLHGGLTAEQREKMVRRFQVKDNRKMLFVLSLKAGGVGLNLTEASHVIHYDRWWNPAVEEQATDRAYRIGQHKNVHVYKLVCEGTLEERIDELIEKKKGLTKQILGKGENWLTEMSDKDIYDLIKLRERVI